MKYDLMPFGYFVVVLFHGWRNECNILKYANYLISILNRTVALNQIHSHFQPPHSFPNNKLMKNKKKYIHIKHLLLLPTSYNFISYAIKNLFDNFSISRSVYSYYKLKLQENWWIEMASTTRGLDISLPAAWAKYKIHLRPCSYKTRG